jgi:hypothetical protein
MKATKVASVSKVSSVSIVLDYNSDDCSSSNFLEWQVVTHKVMGVTYGSLSNIILRGANDSGARQPRPPLPTAAQLVADTEDSLDYRELASDYESHRKAYNKRKEAAINLTLKQMFSDIVFTISERSQLKIF